MRRFARLTPVLRALLVPAALLLAACQGPPPTESTVDKADFLVRHD